MCNESEQAERKKLAIKYFMFAIIAFAGIYAVQIFHLFELLFQPVYRGNISTVVYCAITVAVWIPFIILLRKFVLKHTGYKLFNRENPPIPFKRACIIYACVFVPIFIISACLGFELKIVYELGKRVTQLQIIKNASLYAQGCVELILALVCLELVQEGMELLYRGKHANIIPWGGIALALTYGFAEVLVAYLSGANVLFAWLNIAFFLLYGVIYLLSKKIFSITLFAAIMIYLL